MVRFQPRLAVIGWTIATLIGLYLVVSTLLRDRKDEERAKLKWK